MEHPYDLNCYSVPNEIIRLGAFVLLYAYSRKFIDQLRDPRITYKKGWYQFRYHKSGNPICISISWDGTKYRNTQKYYRKNRLPKQEGLVCELDTLYGLPYLSAPLLQQ